MVMRRSLPLCLKITGEQYPDISPSTTALFHNVLPVFLSRATTEAFFPPGVQINWLPLIRIDSLCPHCGNSASKTFAMSTVHRILPVFESKQRTLPTPLSRYTRSPSTVGVPRTPGYWPLHSVP